MNKRPPPHTAVLDPELGYEVVTAPAENRCYLKQDPDTECVYTMDTDQRCRIRDCNAPSIIYLKKEDYITLKLLNKL
jgi:hypothetical protein